jgi:ribonuclease HII
LIGQKLAEFPKTLTLMLKKTTSSWSKFNLNDYLTNSEAMVAGVDEVGRGCLFGSVVAAAVVLPIKSIVRLEEIVVRDSKKLTAKKRENLVNQIEEIVTDWQIAAVDNQIIDQINIFQASLQAMTEAVNQLKYAPALCLIDGKFTLPNLKYPQLNLVKGDERSTVIASASIVAKVWRDQQMSQYAEQFPQYDLEQNKGYPTKKHLEAIKKYGISPLHRQSFSPCQSHPV